VALSPAERETLERWASGVDRRLARRAAIVLALGAGQDTKALARRFRLSEPTVGKWRLRFEASRLAGLVDPVRSGTTRRIQADDVERVLSHLRQPPPEGATRWTTRGLARACGVSQTTVSRIWRAHGVDPRSGALPAQGRVEAAPTTAPPVPKAAAPVQSGDGRAAELARLARELADLKAIAPLEEAPFLRVALEAIGNALACATPSHMGGEGARLAGIRAEAAVAQARALVAEARTRISRPCAVGDVTADRRVAPGPDGE
jgi:transposase